MDDVSYKLGEISAGQNILAQRSTKVEERMDAIHADLLDIKQMLEPLAKDAVWMKPQVEHYQRLRGRAGWVGGTMVAMFVSCLAAVSGALGNWFFKKYGA